MGRFLPTTLVSLATAAVLPRGAQAQMFRHFDIKADLATTASKLTSVSLDMIERAADQQAALQVGGCASLWNKQLSTQCPPGSFMAMRERRGLMSASIFQCQAAGCLHALGAGEDAPVGIVSGVHGVAAGIIVLRWVSYTYYGRRGTAVIRTHDGP